MAAYAALISLMNTLNNIQIHPRVSTFLDKKQIESLNEKLDFLLDFEENFSSHRNGEEDLGSQIASAAQAAEDVIESQIVDRIESESTGTSPSCFLINLQKIIEQAESIVEKVKKVKDQQPTYSRPVASSRSPPPTGKTTMVGFDRYLMQLLDLLTGQQSDRQIIPIVGMGGIGKTTLARNAYVNLLTVENFDVRAWVTVSQEYNVREIFIEILTSLGVSYSKEDETTEDELGDQLYKILFDRRYLIVLDDMWSVEAWDKIRTFFPKNVNRSRIVVTTRQSDVSNHFGSLALALSFLDGHKSWDLFCEKAFGQEGCPHDLEEIGRIIVEKCRGLPLAIVVIGGLLRKSSRTHEYWEIVERDLTSVLSSEEDNQCFSILSLSYTHLPPCLKPCFLYFGIFPEDHEINISQLIKLWVAEGFLKPSMEQSLEEVAEGYMKDLVYRNLISVRKLSQIGNIKTCSIHDLVRDLCMKVAEKEKFFFVLKEHDAPGDMDNERRIIIHDKFVEMEDGIGVSLKSARSVIGQGWYELLSKPRMLRVMSNTCGSMRTALRQVNLRFLDDFNNYYFLGNTTYKLPSSISPLWNLQTLILFATVLFAPSEIWEMPQLRHFKCRWIILPDPPRSDEQDVIVLQNLQTLKMVQDIRCSVDIYKKMPNIKKLQIDFNYDFEDEGREPSDYCHYNFSCLKKLESLVFFCNSLSTRDDLLENLRFPNSLKKLTLGHCDLHWDDLTVIGSLPRLEVLKLEYSLHGAERNPVEGEFRRLKFLAISNCPYLVSWNADKSHFPVLEMLVLLEVFELEEIPLGIGDIDTLRFIRLRECKVSSAISAVRILEEQESLGNEVLRVQVEFLMQMYLDKFEQEVELQDLSFPRHNFQLLYCGF